jgi:hypothetical protein
MAYQNIIKCESCIRATGCKKLNSYICNDYGPEVDSISRLDNSITVEGGVPGLSLDDLF